MQEYKIIFAGSMGAGKTTAVKALSDVGVISSDVANTDVNTHSKLLTTVGIDYGQVILPPDSKVGLYGTPGQERFEIVWRIVTNGALGVIILIDSSSPKASSELRYYTQYFHQHELRHIVIGLTHNDLPNRKLNRESAMKIINGDQFTYPVFEIDARQRDDLLLLVETLIASIEAEIN